MISITLFMILFLSLVANPAPVSIELADITLIALPIMIGTLSLVANNEHKLYKTEINLLIAILIYLSYLLCSALMALAQGIPLLNILRSIGPYINFFPLLFISLLTGRALNPWVVAIIIASVGMMHAGYQIYLYITHATHAIDTISVLRNRITLIEPRTTLPLSLAAAIMPLCLLTMKNKLLHLIGAGLFLLAVLANAATLTRSIIISIFIGSITFITLCFYKQLREKILSYQRIIITASIYVAIFLVFVSIISLIPKVRMLEQGLFARFYHYSSLTSSHDYSNGRIYDEWLPAIHLWANSGTLKLLFGIGSGNIFRVTTGEERTYIHNLLIYSLVYGGIYGLFACLWLYFTIFKTFIIRAFETNQPIYIAYASLLVSIFFYGQLFAVHKGLAFNAMLFVMIAIALQHPAMMKSQPRSM